VDDAQAQIALERLRAYNRYRQAIQTAQQKLDETLAQIDKAAAEIGDDVLELLCLVRITPGPDHTVYHSARYPCGRVRDRKNFREVTETRAMREGEFDHCLSRCRACDWKKAAADAARPD
jgi:hypothetical protein